MFYTEIDPNTLSTNTAVMKREKPLKKARRITAARKPTHRETTDNVLYYKVAGAGLYELAKRWGDVDLNKLSYRYRMLCQEQILRPSTPLTKEAETLLREIFTAEKELGVSPKKALYHLLGSKPELIESVRRSYQAVSDSQRTAEEDTLADKLEQLADIMRDVAVTLRSRYVSVLRR